MTQSQVPPRQPMMYMPQSHLYPVGGARQNRQQHMSQQPPQMFMPQRQMPQMSVQQQMMQPMPQMYMPQQMSMPPMYMQPMQRKRQGGILSKLFGKKEEAQQEMPYMTRGASPMMPTSNYQAPYEQPMMQARQASEPIRMMPQAAATSATAAASSTASSGIGSFFSNLVANPSSIIGNVEKIVQVAQTVGPVVQQYSPLVRNFPGLMKILNAVTPSPNSTEETATEAVVDEAPASTPVSVQLEETAAPKKKQKPAALPQAEEIPILSQPAQPQQPAMKTPLPKLYV